MWILDACKIDLKKMSASTIAYFVGTIVLITIERPDETY